MHCAVYYTPIWLSWDVLKLWLCGNSILELFCERCRDANSTMLRANSSPSHLAICVPTGELIGEFPQCTVSGPITQNWLEQHWQLFWWERTFIYPEFNTGSVGIWFQYYSISLGNIIRKCAQPQRPSAKWGHAWTIFKYKVSIFWLYNPTNVTLKVRSIT